jgi:tight adherence protein B
MSVVLILIILSIVIICGLVAYMLITQKKTRSQKAIQLVQGGVGAVRSKKDEQHIRRASIAGKLKEDKKSGQDTKQKNTVRLALLRAGLQMSVKKYWLLSSLLALVVTALLYLSGQSPFVIICGGLTALLGLPKVILNKMAASRQKKFLEDFPDALEAVVRLLKAGMPVSEAVSMSAKEFSGPVAEEMAHMYDRQKIGIPLHEAAREACQRIALTEMNMFATSLAIQAQTGSSLSEVLLNLSNMIRSRFRLKRKVKALSSEAIASASIIAALPILVAGGMYLTNKDYISILFTDPFGKLLLFGAIAWMGMGVMMMKIMINFKV